MNSNPEGSLTVSQYEIMQVVWAAGDKGVSVKKVWEAISSSRQVSKTTILNQVSRLEKRNWLLRQEQEGVNRYVATVSKENTSHQMADEFLNDFFEGSTQQLVQSFLGSGKVDKSELEELRRLLDKAISEEDQ